MRTKKRSAKNLTAAAVFLFLTLAPLFLSAFRVSLLGKFMCFALVALGVDMIWGYTGILSLGHGVYFGIGAYVMAMYLKLQASGAALPDFMVWSGLNRLPLLWEPFHSPVFTVFAVLTMPAAVAAVIGYLTFLNRIRGVYFSIISQALAAALATLLIGMQQYIGGFNGLTNFGPIFGGHINSPATKLILYYTALFCLAAAFVLCSFLVSRRLGGILIAIRDAENRAMFTGYDPTAYKVFVYCLSALLAGVAGALYVSQVGIISPKDVNIAPSIEMVVWVAIGGKATLIGPIIGALLTNLMKSLVSEHFPAAWSYFIGFAFILTVLFLPHGLVSIRDIPIGFARLLTRERRRDPDRSARNIPPVPPADDAVPAPTGKKGGA